MRIPAGTLIEEAGAGRRTREPGKKKETEENEKEVMMMSTEFHSIQMYISLNSQQDTAKDV
jgi:hypothetical protein